MLILRLFRYLLGYVRFAAWGGFPERFINLCEHNRILLWDVRSRDGVITACTDRSGYKRMRCAARRSGMRLRIKKKCGLPFFLNRHSRDSQKFSLTMLYLLIRTKKFCIISALT